MLPLPTAPLLALLTQFSPATAEAPPHPPPPGEPTSWSLEVEADVRLDGFSLGFGEDLVFVHGGPSFPPLEMPPWLFALSHEKRVHLFHQRGSGRSSRPIARLPEDEDRARSLLRERYGLERHLDDLERVLDSRLGSDRRAILVGHSFGAYLAALHAARSPQRLSALVLLAPADVLDGRLVSKPIFDRLAADLSEEERPLYRQRLNSLMRPDSVGGSTDAELARLTDWFGWYYLNAMGSALPRPDSYPPMKWAGGLSVVGLLTDVHACGDATQTLGSIRVPTLVLHAADDLTLPAVAEAFAQAIPTAELQTIEGCSHFFEGVELELAARVLDFLAGREEPRGGDSHAGGR